MRMKHGGSREGMPHFYMVSIYADDLAPLPHERYHMKESLLSEARNEIAAKSGLTIAQSLSVIRLDRGDTNCSDQASLSLSRGSSPAMSD